MKYTQFSLPSSGQGPELHPERSCKVGPLTSSMHVCVCVCVCVCRHVPHNKEDRDGQPVSPGEFPSSRQLHTTPPACNRSPHWSVHTHPHAHALLSTRMCTPTHAHTHNPPSPPLSLQGYRGAPPRCTSRPRPSSPRPPPTSRTRPSATPLTSAHRTP